MPPPLIRLFTMQIIPWQFCQVFSGLFELSSGHCFVHTALEQHNEGAGGTMQSPPFSDAGKDL